MNSKLYRLYTVPLRNQQHQSSELGLMIMTTTTTTTTRNPKVIWEGVGRDAANASLVTMGNLTFAPIITTTRGLMPKPN